MDLAQLDNYESFGVPSLENVRLAIAGDETEGQGQI